MTGEEAGADSRGGGDLPHHQPGVHHRGGRVLAHPVRQLRGHRAHLHRLHGAGLRDVCLWSREVHPGHHGHDGGEAGAILADHMEVSTPDNDSVDDDDDVQVRVPGPDGWHHPEQPLLHDVTLAHLHCLGPGHGHRSPCAIPRLENGGGRHPRHVQPGAHHLRHGESQSECLHLLTDPTQVTEALRGQDRAEVRTNKFYRVDTAASTRPMLGEFQVITLY